MAADLLPAKTPVQEFAEALKAFHRSKMPVQLEKLKAIRSQHSNWVVPGRVMCGPYPGLDGINFPSVEAATQNLSSILADGVDTFVSLVEECPPQEKHTPGVLPAPHPFFPQYANYAHTIDKQKLRSASGQPVEYLHFPVTDGCPAKSKAVFLQHLAAMMRLLVRGRSLYIHCAGGHGRTGVYVAGLLCCMSPRDPVENILRFVQYAHDLRQTHDKKCGGVLPAPSPSNEGQVRFVREFSCFLSFLL